MANTSTGSVAAAAPKNLLARFVGIITSPRETFQSVVAHPRWLGMLLLTSGIIAIGTAGPMMTEAGRQAALDKQVQQMESFGFQVNEEMYSRMQQGMKRAPYTTAISILVISPIIAVIIAGILFAVFNAAMGGDATFKQLYSVIIHAGVISAAAQFFTAPLNVIRGSMESATNLGVLLPMLQQGSFLARLFGMVDLFVIWWVIVLAMGLAVLYRRRTQPIAFTLLGVYALIAVCAAAIMSRFGGRN
jgi:hypothetical protein